MIDFLRLAVFFRCTKDDPLTTCIHKADAFSNEILRLAKDHKTISNLLEIFSRRFPNLLPNEHDTEADVLRSFPHLIRYNPHPPKTKADLEKLETYLGELTHDHKELLTQHSGLEILMLNEMVWRPMEACCKVLKASEELYDCILKYTVENWKEHAGQSDFLKWPIFTHAGKLCCDDLKDPKFILLSQLTDGHDAIVAAYHLRCANLVPVFWIDWMADVQCRLLGNTISEAIGTLINLSIQEFIEFLVNENPFGISTIQPLPPNAFFCKRGLV